LLTDQQGQGAQATLANAESSSRILRQIQIHSLNHKSLNHQRVETAAPEIHLRMASHHANHVCQREILHQKTGQQTQFDFSRALLFGIEQLTIEFAVVQLIPFFDNSVFAYSEPGHPCDINAPASGGPSKKWSVIHACEPMSICNMFPIRNGSRNRLLKGCEPFKKGSREALYLFKPMVRLREATEV
jgi:hypothetical protein